MAAYTPIEKITTCEILPNGKYIVLALHNHPNLVTLKLRQPAAAAASPAGDAAAASQSTGESPAPAAAETDEEEEAVVCYGRAENEGKVAQL